MHSRLSCQPNFWQDDIIVEIVFFYNPFFRWILHCSWIISWRKYVYDNFCCCYINYDNLVLRPSFFSFVCVHITFSLYKNRLCGKTIAWVLVLRQNCISIYQFIQSCYLSLHIVLLQGYTRPFEPKLQKRWRSFI